MSSLQSKNKPLPLAGRRVLVTGGHKRIGQVASLLCGRMGADVVVHYREDAAAAAQTVAELLQLQVRAVCVHAELTDSAQVADLIRKSVEALGGLDTLIVAAASFERTPIRQCDAAAIDRNLHNNARAPVDLILQSRMALTKNRLGRVIVFGDLAAQKPLKDYVAHSMAKAALHAAVLALAAELAPQIAINAIVPGAVLQPAPMSEETWQNILAKVPMGVQLQRDPRAGVQAIEQALAFFLTAGAFVSGVLLPIHGAEK